MDSFIPKLLPLLLLGFFLGMRHATDADHVVAVTTIVSRERTIRSSALIGALWGIGHTVTLLFVGGTILVLGIVIPPRLGLTMEFSVAVVLMLLGAFNVHGILATAREARAGDANQGDQHRHDGHPHRHDQTVLPSWVNRVLGRTPLSLAIRPFVVGVVHGLAGSAAVALLVLATVRDAWWGIGYLLLFGFGTIAGMMLITFTIAVPISVATRRFARTNRTLGLVSGVLSLTFGIFLAYQIGVVDGLFTGAPQFTPH